ncbi:signal recognition particle-docking protein FtsY [Cardiobacteriaceae bacterium TAE3-ERU3]|nr:signal recognition particle-docking protein FtsY [Cardiobacteriaceae bacterium TAE3-ERU3]
MAFKWLKKRKKDTDTVQQQENQTVAQTEQLPAEVSADSDSKSGYFQRLKQGLSKTRSGFGDLFLGKKTLDPDTVDDLEMQLLSADVGLETTKILIDDLTKRIDRKELGDLEAVQSALALHMADRLTPYEQPLQTALAKPFVILMTGINGAGKTTTIGKLAHQFKAEGKKVMLAAGDTFRAAAVEQLKEWGERNEVPVIAQGHGADPASVAYDALQSAQARNIDVLIIDTAGRLHTQDHLMDELKKIKRVLHKLDPQAPHETMLVLDAGNGQNALRQAMHFHQAMDLTGLAITKLDGTAKGGILFAVTHELELPIRYIGVGEKAADLRVFNANAFVDALLYKD